MKKQQFRTLKTVCGLASILVLGACSGMPGFLSSSGPKAPAGQTTKRMADDALNALCTGRADDALTILTAEPLVSPVDQFFTAVALEESGRPSRARLLYGKLMQSGSSEYVEIHCGGNSLANGSVADEAAKRLATVSKNLAILDANLRPNIPLHTGLPSASESNGGSGSSFMSLGSATTVTRPGSQSPFGQWFAHLSSYMSLENANKNKPTLEADFPALAGIIDQWEVDVGGRRAIRLGIRVENKADAERLCSAVKSQGKYCAVIDTSS